MALGNVPEFLARQGDGPMDDEELEAVIASAIADSIQYVDTELSPDRVKATEYYQGQPFGNEEEGRSQAVLTEVRDGIIGVLPSVLRVVHGPEHAVEIVPRRGDQVAQAEQATDYIRYVYEEDNSGFLVTHSVLKDGLLKKIGIVKWGMDEKQEPRQTMYRRVSREDLMLLLADERVTPVRITPREDGLFDAELSHLEIKGRIWIRPVPPDDFFWNREARSLDDAILVGHRERLTRGELRAMGVSEADIEEHAGATSSVNLSLEEVARRQAFVSGWSSDPEMGTENQRVLYCEVYVHLDMDGDGIAELRKVCTIGDTHFPVKNEPADSVPFAFFAPDPEPHAMLGGSYYDRLASIQKINSQLLRTVLDSGSAAAFPRIGYVEGQVSVADILNNAIGAPIRMRLPGMIQPIEIPFSGEKLMPILGFMQEVIERRIGQKDGAGSLDIDALQSTGKEAVNAAITAATAQPELLARLFCEQVLKPMFRGILRLVAHPASKERIIRLRGNYVPVNPAEWEADMDVSVNVALGSMDTAKKIAVLTQVVSDQSAILDKFGPENPVVTIAMLRNAKARILALSGVKDVDNYYKPVPDDWKAPPPPPKEPTSDELWIQAEKEMAFQKSMKELAIKQDELRLREEDQRERLVLDREIMERDFDLRRYDIDVKAATALKSEEMKAEAAKDAIKEGNDLADDSVAD